MISPERGIVVRVADLKDRQRWDTYVMNHPEASPYHLFAWKLAVEESYGHTCHYLYVESNGDLTGVLPLVHIRFPGIINELSALPYCDVGNCLSDCNQVQDALLKEALNLSKILRSTSLNLRGSLRETELKNAFFHSEESGKVRMLLDLPPSSDMLFAGFKSKLRSQIHKAEKNSISFTWGGLEDLDDVYSVFSRNMHNLGSPVHSKGWLKNIMIHYAQKLKIGLARFKEKTVGIGIILLGGQGVSIPWASTLREHNHLGVNMLLYWKLLEFSADNGFSYFDFGRSTEHEGTYKFKKQWGAEPRPLVWYSLVEPNQREDVHSPHQSATRKIAATLWQKAPLSLANTLGPCLRKYISL